MAKREIKRPVTEEDIRAWEDGWSEMMITIWREKIMSLGIVDTMTLYNRLSHVVSRAEGVTAVTHEFMEYGIFMENGVGNGYNRGNGGNLNFLDPSIRHWLGIDKPRPRGPKTSTKDTTTGKPRERRPWFSRRYLSSIRVLNTVERDLYVNAYMGTLSNVVRLMFDTHNFVEKVKKGKLTDAERSAINL